MRAWIASGVVIAMLVGAGPAFGQPDTTSVAERFVDAANGLSLEQAVERAFAQEPSLRAARSGIDAARGRQAQAALRPNPSVSFERRTEPAGADSQTMVAAEWPLDLFRRNSRMAVADRELAAVQHAVADERRRMAAEVRLRYAELLVQTRDLALFDEIIAATRRQRELLGARVDEGASPPLERDLLDVEVRRLQSERLIQTGMTEAALLELKRVLGMSPEDTLLLRDTLEGLVARELTTAPGSGSSLIAPNAIDDRADVQQAATQVAAADARIERARQEGRFDVSLVAGYMRMDAGFPQAGLAPGGGGVVPIRGLFHYVSAGAMISLPLRNRNQGEVAVARAERAAAAAVHDATRLSAEAELASARIRDEHAREAVQLFDGGVRTLAQQNLSVVRQSYELGRVNVFAVLAEERRYLDLERAYTGTLKTAFEARTALKRALGEGQ